MRLDVDSYEQEVEWDRLSAALTGEGADDLVNHLQSSHIRLGGGSKLIHLYAVAELAAQHAHLYYDEHEFNEQRYRKLSCKLAGLMHECMEWGATFEDVVQASDEFVAKMVAAMTPDRRMAHSKRIMQMTNALGLADAPAQLVKLAELQHDCFHLMGLPARQFTEPAMAGIARWVEDARDVVVVLGKVQECPILAQSLLDLREQIGELSDRNQALWKKRTRKAR